MLLHLSLLRKRKVLRCSFQIIFRCLSKGTNQKEHDHVGCQKVGEVLLKKRTTSIEGGSKKGSNTFTVTEKEVDRTKKCYQKQAESNQNIKHLMTKGFTLPKAPSISQKLKLCSLAATSNSGGS